MTSSKSIYNFSSKVVLITGSSSGNFLKFYTKNNCVVFKGIGAACAKLFAKHGAKVVICGFETDEVEQMVQQIKTITGEKPFSMAGNLTEDGFAEKLVKGTIDHYGRLDILLNNAGKFLCLFKKFFSLLNV